jgi:hypothetical protein
MSVALAVNGLMCSLLKTILLADGDQQTVAQDEFFHHKILFVEINQIPNKKIDNLIKFKQIWCSSVQNQPKS